MKIVEVTDPSFAKYGRIIEDLDTAELVNAMEKTPLPEDVVYEPSEASLEELEAVVPKNAAKAVYEHFHREDTHGQEDPAPDNRREETGHDGAAD